MGNKVTSMSGNVFYVECECESAEHVIRFVADDEDKELYMEVQLVNCSYWWRRAWKALKYVFGYECKFGHWDVTILNIKERNKIREILSHFNDNPTL